MSLLIATPAKDLHDPGPGHPERSARLVAALAGLEDAPIREAVVHLPPRLASRAELSIVHDPGYLEALADLCAKRGRVIGSRHHGQSGVVGDGPDDGGRGLGCR